MSRSIRFVSCSFSPNLCFASSSSSVCLTGKFVRRYVRNFIKRGIILLHDNNFLTVDGTHQGTEYRQLTKLELLETLVWEINFVAVTIPQVRSFHFLILIDKYWG